MRTKQLSLSTSIKDFQLALKQSNSVRAGRTQRVNSNILVRGSCETPIAFCSKVASAGRESKYSVSKSIAFLTRKPSMPVNLNLNENRMISNVLINEKPEKIQKLPLTAEKARKIFDRNLNNYEKIEIFTYKEIFYVGPENKAECKDYDDDKKNLLLCQDDQVAYRYQIKKLLGVGSFSQVYQAYDWKKKMMVAIKVIRNKEKYKKQSLNEVSFLKLVKEKADNLPFAYILARFEFREHVCIVFKILERPLLGQVHYFKDLLKYSIDILACLQFLHSNKIVHCDLKPSNVMVNNSVAHLIDLGTATRMSEQVFKYIQSRSYRAPEVIFRLKFNEKIDVWSFGCVLFEVATGKVIFDGKNENEVLDQMVGTIGDPPNKWKKFFQVKVLEGQKGNLGRVGDLVEDLHPLIQEVIFKSLVWNPKKRASACELLGIFKKYVE